jgi:hypothetical protein
MKKLLALSMFLLASIAAWGQQSADDAIKATVTNYFEGVTTGDAATFNAATGKIQDIPVKTFISKTPAGGVKASTKLISYSYAGVSGLAAVEMQFDEFKYIDLLSLLQVNDEWKIVARVFSRVDLDTQLKGSASTATKTTGKTPAAAPAKKSTANTKPKKDDGW